MPTADLGRSFGLSARTRLTDVDYQPTIRLEDGLPPYSIRLIRPSTLSHPISLGFLKQLVAFAVRRAPLAHLHLDPRT